MSKFISLVFIAVILFSGCSNAEDTKHDVSFWVERITFTMVHYNTDVDSFEVSSDWVSMLRKDLKDAVIEKRDWYYVIDHKYWVKENPLDFIR